MPQSVSATMQYRRCHMGMTDDIQTDRQTNKLPVHCNKIIIYL